VNPRFSIFAWAALFVSSAAALPDQSVSSSRQFTVVCEQRDARIRTTTYCEEIKSAFLNVLGMEDLWKFPIVVSIRNSPGPVRPAASVRMFEADVGLKIDVDINLAGDLSGVHLGQELLRALILEMAYREHGAMRQGAEYADAPSWLVEGMARYLETRDSGADASVYRSLIESNRLPSFADFLAETPAGMDSTSLDLYDACALSLVQLLIDLPDGRVRLASYIRALPAGGDAASGLIRGFPMLGSSTDGLEKWWTLGIARLSASDRYEGLSAEETEQRLATALVLKMGNTGNGVDTKDFRLEDFKAFMKNPRRRSAIFQMNEKLVRLSTQANALFRPVIAEYQQVALDLLRGKTKDVPGRLEALSTYREMIATRMTEIGDYLNWFEATQMHTSSNSFDGYVKTANELSAPPAGRDDAISRYMAALQAQTE